MQLKIFPPSTLNPQPRHQTSVCPLQTFLTHHLFQLVAGLDSSQSTRLEFGSTTLGSTSLSRRRRLSHHLRSSLRHFRGRTRPPQDRRFTGRRFTGRTFTGRAFTGRAFTGRTFAAGSLPPSAAAAAAVVAGSAIVVDAGRCARVPAAAGGAGALGSSRGVRGKRRPPLARHRV